MLTLEPPARVITFDCYGTLVQWKEALRDAARVVLTAHFQDATPELIKVIAENIRSRATVYQQQRSYRPYAAVLKASLADAFAELGVQATEEDHRTLWASLSQIQRHPDTLAALNRLRTRYHLAIISNTDDGLIAGTVDGLGVPIDFVVTAQQAEAYKPDHRLFTYAHSKIGVSASQTIHVAMGQFADLKVCKELGIRSVWINREREPLDPAYSPDAILSDLTALPDLLLGR